MGKRETGKGLEMLRGKKERESGFPLNRARHSGSRKQVRGPGLSAPLGSGDLCGPPVSLGEPPEPRDSRLGPPASAL